MTPSPLYCDHDSSDEDLVAQLRSLGIDVVTALEANNRYATDLEQLEFATLHGRAIYTANKGHFANLHAEWMREGRHHAGILVRRNQKADVGTQLRSLSAVFEAYRDGLVDMLLWV